MIIKKNIKYGLLSFLLGLNVSLQAIDDDLLDSLHSPVDSGKTVGGLDHAIGRGAAKTGDSGSDSSGSSGERCSVGSYSTNTRIALTLIDTMELAHRHLGDHSTISSGSCVSAAVVNASDVTQSAPAAPSRSPSEVKIELAALDLGSGQSRAVASSMAVLKAGLLGGGFRERLDIDRLGAGKPDVLADMRELGIDDSADSGTGLGSLVDWQVRNTPRVTHADFVDTVSLVGFNVEPISSSRADHCTPVGDSGAGGRS